MPFFGFLLIIALLPFLKFVVLRIFLYLKLKNTCKKYGFTLKCKSFFSIFKKINGKQNDIYIETLTCVYSIKLIGFFFKKKYLNFTTPNEYHIREMSFSLMLIDAFGQQYKSYKKQVCNFSAHLPINSNLKSMKCCYLLYPNLHKAMKISCGQNRMTEIISGDRVEHASIYPTYFYTLRGLLNELKNS